jgi:hypothetical protein
LLLPAKTNIKLPMGSILGSCQSEECCKTIGILLKMAIKALVANTEEDASRKLDPYCGKQLNKINMSTIAGIFLILSDRNLDNTLIQ